MKRRSDISTKTAGTCDWIFSHSTYCEWLENGGLLWINGRPGTGKSTLMHSLLEEQAKGSKKSRLVASYFFHARARGEQLRHSKIGVLRSLLHQILSYDSRLLSRFLEETQFEERLKGNENTDSTVHWEEAELTSYLATYVRQFVEIDTLCIYIDALDEAGKTIAEELMEYVRDLCPSPSPRLSICVSCRPWPPVISDSQWDYCIPIEPEIVGDIRKYTHSKLQQYMSDENKAQLTEIENEITSRASDVFQWAVQVTKRVTSLNSSRDHEDFAWSSVLNDIKEIPQDLSDMYQSMFDHLQEPTRQRDRILALQILRWITFAARPLSLVELRYAVAFDEDDPNKALQTIKECEESDHWCDNDIKMEKRVRRLSSGLVNFVGSDKLGVTLQFDHESVQDYMTNKGIPFLEMRNPTDPDNGTIGQAHYRLLMSCLRYIRASSREYSMRLPFDAYAHLCCKHHMNAAYSQGVSLDNLVSFTQWPSNKIWARIRGMEQATEHPLDIFFPFAATTLQHCAVECGLYRLMAAVLPLCKGSQVERSWYSYGSNTSGNDSINAQDFKGRTPLSLAAELGREDIVELLINSKKVILNAFGYGYDHTELDYAAASGNSAVVKLLLKQERANVKKTTLCAAAQKGDHRSFKLLMDAYEPPISVSDAANGRRKAPLGRLLNMSGRNRYHPLVGAAALGSVEMVRTLISQGAQINNGLELSLHRASLKLHISHGCTALQASAARGHLEVVELLLAVNADVEAAPDAAPYVAFHGGRTALQAAAEHGHFKVVESLLAAKADVNAAPSKNRGCTALQGATKAGNLAISQLLLSSGANINAQGWGPAETNQGDGFTALHFAAYYGHPEILALLLRHFADISIKNSESRTALHVAVARCHPEIVKALISAGSDLNARDKNGRTPLHLAVVNDQHYRHDICDLLLEAGADVNMVDEWLQTSLHLAVDRKNLDIVKSLVQAGSDLTARNSYNRTPLENAEIRRKKGVGNWNTTEDVIRLDTLIEYLRYPSIVGDLISLPGKFPL